MLDLMWGQSLRETKATGALNFVVSWQSLPWASLRPGICMVSGPGLRPESSRNVQLFVGEADMPEMVDNGF